MPLDSPENTAEIVRLALLENWSDALIMTAAIEVLENSGHSTFYSSPGGNRINFIRLASTIGERTSDMPGSYSIVIYHGQYYARDSIVDVGTPDVCACEHRGEQLLYNSHADFGAIYVQRFLPQCRPKNSYDSRAGVWLLNSSKLHVP